jgi:hypothetical protein
VREENQTMSLDIQPLASEKRMMVDEGVRLRFKLVDPRTDRPLRVSEPLGALILHGAGKWKRHAWAHPHGGGVFEIAFPIPWPGTYYLFFACRSQGWGPADLPYLTVQSDGSGLTALSRTPEAAASQC